ncbi:MAG TPA: LLM class flavin-dependent oxidoreductase [Ktedonobacterales bacterium]|jgi:alkanesulfonate monooxygenase SsuD/methylene tetrahydromethanopterin reductase-like flavin-dependent oxidoreductase (luciferase family)
MRYGLELANGGVMADPRTLAELARLAEESGWDGVFLEDYIVWQGHGDLPACDPWVALAAMALSTTRVRLGTTVTPLPRRRPWKLAREVVTVDHLSNGRVTLGVGLGDIGDPGFTQVGEELDTTRRARMLDEGLAVLAGLWSGNPFTHDGEFYHVRDLRLLPRPLQTPRIPIWVGGNWPTRGVIRRAARWDGFVGGRNHGPDEDWHLTPDEVRALWADIARERRSDEPFDIALGGGERGPDLDAERAMIRAVADAGATWWMEYAPPTLGDLAAICARIAGGPVRID